MPAFYQVALQRRGENEDAATMIDEFERATLVIINNGNAARAMTVTRAQNSFIRLCQNGKLVGPE